LVLASGITQSVRFEPEFSQIELDINVRDDASLKEASVFIAFMVSAMNIREGNNGK
jgi:hypothetical protein